MRILLAFIIITFSTSAYAETITVIHDDGTKTSIEIGPTPSVEPVPQSSAPPRTVTADPVPAAKPVKAPAKSAETKPVKKPAPPKQAAKKTPVKKEAVKKQSASAKKKTAKAVEKKAQPKADQPKTAKKKAAPTAPVAAAKAPEPRPVTASAQRLGEQMTSDDAIRIALDVAPPARSVHAVPVNYKGLHAYQVIFATEDGDRSVFVDRETGKIAP